MQPSVSAVVLNFQCKHSLADNATILKTITGVQGGRETEMVRLGGNGQVLVCVSWEGGEGVNVCLGREGEEDRSNIVICRGVQLFMGIVLLPDPPPPPPYRVHCKVGVLKKTLIIICNQNTRLCEQ